MLRSIRLPDPQHREVGNPMLPTPNSHLVGVTYRRKRRPLFAASCLCLGLITTSAAMAEVALPNVFSDHMVLQRRQPNKVWGKAAAGEKVSVSIGTQSLAATAAADGTWQVMLAPMEASNSPLRLMVKGQANQVAVDDVLVGEVWIASGQSNMEYALSSAYDADLELAAANDPGIRFITYPNVGAQTPICVTSPRSRSGRTSASNHSMSSPSA